MTDLHNLQSGGMARLQRRPLYELHLELYRLVRIIEHNLRDTQKEQLKIMVCPPTGGGPLHPPAASNPVEKDTPKDREVEPCDKYTAIINKLEKVVNTYKANDEMNKLIAEYEVDTRRFQEQIDYNAQAARNRTQERLDQRKRGEGGRKRRRKTRKRRKSRKAKKSRRRRK